MKKPQLYHMEKRSVLLFSACFGILLFSSSLSVIYTEEVFASWWETFRISAASVLSRHVGILHSSCYAPRPLNFERSREDDPQCLSRTQQYLYRNPHSVKPIPATIVQAWANYTKMHNSCYHKNWTDLFLRRDDAHLNNKNGCQYLIYIEGREGLGNGLLSLASAFTFALATDRVLLIDHRKNIARLLCDPFPEASWVLPIDFPYGELQNSSSLGPFRHTGANSSTVSLNLNHVIGSNDQQFFCEEAQVSLQNAKWVAWTSNQYFLTNLFLVPSFWQRMHPIFDTSVDHIFNFISRLIFLPANDTWAIILREYWSYLSGSKSQLGVQVRLHGRPNLAEFDTTANDKVMECLLQKGFLPSFAEEENMTELSYLYKNKKFLTDTHEELESGADIVVLIASLQGRYAGLMKDKFRKVPTKGTKMVRVHSVSSLGHENKGFGQAQLAMVEMWLLSMSDNLATSEYSTFGYVAQGLGDKRPYILGLKKEGHISPCVLGQSAEPCSHYPKVPRACLGANANLSEGHKAWIRTHIRHCQDHEQGWQLVPRGGSSAQGKPVSFDFL